MTSLSEDASRYLDFKASQAPLDNSALEFKLELYERSRGSSPARPFDNIRDVGPLRERRSYDLRIIFAPLDLALGPTSGIFVELFRYLEIPSGFVSERLQSVRHSYGGRRDKSGLRATWFHFLCRSPNSQEYTRLRSTVSWPENRYEKSLWDRFGLFLKVDPIEEDHGSTAALKMSKTTLVCFGADEYLKTRLRRVVDHEDWENILTDPYILIDIVLDELYLLMDANVNQLSKTFGELESNTINSTEPGQEKGKINFRVLHNLAKDVLFLEESFDAILKTVEAVIDYHSKVFPHRAPIGGVSDLHINVRDGLNYRKSILISSKLQIVSMGKRIQNLIDLAFHLVTQKETHVAQQDSFSMHALALAGLLFLPIATVSSLLETPFFSVNDGNIVHIDHGPIMVIGVVGGVSLVVAAVWLWWYWKARSRVKSSW